jgi:hypothetical protein
VSYSDDILRAWGDPREFITRLFVLNERNKKTPLNPLWEEQVEFLLALIAFRNVFAVKPRQVGFTTIATAFLLWKAYTSPDPRRVAQMTNDETNQKRLLLVLRTFIENMQPQIRCRLEPDSIDTTGFSHNGAAFDRLLAGAKGQGRGWSYNDVHATEMHKWAAGTSASRGQEEDAASEAWASLLSTVHDPDAHTIVESTGDGPRGLHYRLWLTARTDPEWKLVFVPWSAVPRYRRKPSPNFELDDTERKLMKQHGLDLEQIAWRRWKIKTQGYSEMRFRREYPLTDAEPFSIDFLSWFDGEEINSQLGLVSPAAASADAQRQGGWTFYEAPQRGRSYFAGGDTSGGVERDDAALTILRDDLVEVAHWSSSSASPDEQAHEFHRGAGMYDALLLVEANKYGTYVLRKLREKGGVKLWVDDKGRDFWSEGGKAGDSRRDAYVHARDVFAAGWTLIRTPETLRQMASIIERPKTGKIAPRTDHELDDRAMSWVLAQWCSRRYVSPSGTIDNEKARIQRLLKWRRDGAHVR